MTNDDFEVAATGTHRTFDTSMVRLKVMCDKIDDMLEKFEYHHEFMAGGAPHGET